MLKKILVLFFIIFNLTTLANDYLNFWMPFSGGDAAYMGDLIRAFHRNSDIQIAPVNIEWANYYDKMSRTLLSQNSATELDIAIVHTSKLSDIARTNTLLDISKITKDINFNWNDFSSGALEPTIFNGKHLAVPIDSHALIMYYNVDLLKKANLINTNGSLKIGESEEEFINFFKKIKEAYPDKTPLVSANTNVYPFWIWYALYSQIDGGGKYIENGKAVFNNEAARKALKLVVKLKEEGLWGEKIRDKLSYNLFKFEKGLVTFSGVWSTGNFEQNKKLNFKAVPFPKVYDKKATWGDSHTIIINNKISKKKQIQALKFINWLTDHGYLWAKAGHIPVKKKVLMTSEFKKLKHRSDYSEVINDVNFYPSNPKLWQANDKMVEIFLELMEGSIGVDECLDKAEIQVNKILQP